MAPNHSTNAALWASSQNPWPGPASASMTPVPITASEVRITTGPSTRSNRAAGPFRR
jgi:hypothetical protein